MSIFKYSQNPSNIYIRGFGGPVGSYASKRLAIAFPNAQKIAGYDRRSEQPVPTEQRNGSILLNQLHEHRSPLLDPLPLKPYPVSEVTGNSYAPIHAIEQAEWEGFSKYPHLQKNYQTQIPLKDQNGQPFTGSTGQIVHIDDKPVDIHISATGANTSEDRFKFRNFLDIQHFTACFTGIPMAKPFVRTINTPDPSEAFFCWHLPDKENKQNNKTYFTGFLKDTGEDLSNRIWNMLKTKRPRLPDTFDRSTVTGSTEAQPPKLYSEIFSIAKKAVRGENDILIGTALASMPVDASLNIPSGYNDIETVIYGTQQNWAAKEMNDALLEGKRGDFGASFESMLDENPDFKGSFKEGVAGKMLENVLQDYHEGKIEQKDDYTEMLKEYTVALKEMTRCFSEGKIDHDIDMKIFTDTVREVYKDKPLTIEDYDVIWNKITYGKF